MVALARGTASASSSKGRTTTTGPKISSVAARSPGETSVSTVGGYHQPGPSGTAPRMATGVPSGTKPATVSRWPAEISGPIWVRSSAGALAHPQAGHRRLQQGQELLHGRALDQDAGAGAAVLAGVAEHRRRGGRRGR